MKRIFFDYFSGLILSGIGFFVFVGIYNGLNITYGGDKGKVLFGLFFGLPLGTIIGIVLTEKLIYKIQSWNISGIIVAALLSVIANYFGLIMLDKMGSGTIVIVPLFVAVICLFGYHVVLHLGH
jgi:Co/Zn/Cd efflux system component